MKEVIKKYKKLIWIWTIVCIAGLLINLFEIKCRVGRNNLLMSNTYSEDFWPFVSFVKTYDDFTMYPQYGHNSHTEFRGIFYCFGIAEFVVYMMILIGFLTYKAYIAKPSVKKEVPSLEPGTTV